jgi:hypothetical protein
MNSSPQIVYGTWSASSTIDNTPSFPAPVHWTMSQLDNIPPPAYYPATKEDYYQFDDEEVIPTHVETFAKNMFWWGFRMFNSHRNLCSNFLFKPL